MSILFTSPFPVPEIEEQLLDAYHLEIERSRQPGYVPANLDGEDLE